MAHESLLEGRDMMGELSMQDAYESTSSLK